MLRFVLIPPALAVIVAATVLGEVADAFVLIVGDDGRRSARVERRQAERRTRLVLAKRIASIDGLDRRKGERRKEQR